MSTFRSSQLGPEARPVALPEEDGHSSMPKASGRVQLPTHVRWSGAPKTYDLEVRQDRIRVYEQVLREGTADDVHFYVDVDPLIQVGKSSSHLGHVPAQYSSLPLSPRHPIQ